MRYNYNEIFSLLKDFDFEEKFYEGGLTEERLIDHIDKLSKEEVIVATGVSKFVFSLDSWDYVVKIPFNMMCSHDDEEEDAYPLCQASDDYIDALWDYCAREVFIYESAKNENIDFAFPETQYIGLINKWPIYIQEKCLSMYEAKRTVSPEQRITTIDFIKSNGRSCQIDSAWTATFCLDYGEDKLLELLDFIEFYHIDDLHIGNVGYSYNKYPLIMDFSGFRG